MIAITVAFLVALACGVLLGRWAAPRRTRRGSRDARPEAVRRILLPFTGSSISRRAFDAAVRLARVENATLMPCYLATVPLNLPLDAALPAQCLRAMPLLETIEQRAVAQDVAIDGRVVRGRTFRDALRRILSDEHFDRVIVSAEHQAGHSLTGDDLVWLLDRADAEVMILRPAPADDRAVAAEVIGHF
ncbi:MAG TPA: universal stress protein [Baekduia sp.]|uniref:universal stress protein n=1 Tax=Baekduia sp. TaxID=2600305 RepID=UPI002D78623A|nr:universal stress protein [Baekduia sp.]HET6506129.1 universal stress protein [Baekduia sp.]